MKWELKKNINNNLSFNKDIFGSILFLLIKQDFIKIIAKYIPKKIFNVKKNKNRIFDNLFCHWYFWEAYKQDFKIHPLIINNNFNYLSLKNILKDYLEDKYDELINEILKELDLENKFLKSNNLLKEKELNIKYNINIETNNIKVYLNTEIENHTFYINKKIYNKMKENLDDKNIIALLFRYHVLGSFNNQLATNEIMLKNIDCDLELFASGFNNYYKNYCSIFPDIEKKLGSIGRFQDLEIFEGKYQINPPFQTTMIYEILKKIKVWIENANKNYKKLEFHIFIPNWLNNNNDLNYSKYLVPELLNEIPAEHKISILENENFNYIDYLNDKVKNKTIPDTLYITIKN